MDRDKLKRSLAKDKILLSDNREEVRAYIQKYIIERKLDYAVRVARYKDRSGNVYPLVWLSSGDIGMSTHMYMQEYLSDLLKSLVKDGEDKYKYTISHEYPRGDFAVRNSSEVHDIEHSLDLCMNILTEIEKTEPNLRFQGWFN